MPKQECTAEQKMPLNSTYVRLNNDAELCPGGEGRGELKLGLFFLVRGGVFFQGVLLAKKVTLKVNLQWGQ